MEYLKEIIFRFLLKIKTWFHHFEHKQKLKQYKKIGMKVSIEHPFCHNNPEKISIGNNVSFAAFTHIWGYGGVEIGDNCMIASHCAITSTTHNPQNNLFNSENVHKQVKIGNNVWIGAHSVIFPGITIGDNVVIGAGSIVNKNLEANGVYAGVPCRLLYKLFQSETKNQVKD